MKFFRGETHQRSLFFYPVNTLLAFIAIFQLDDESQFSVVDEKHLLPVSSLILKYILNRSV